MNLPSKYQWIESLKGLPNTINLGLAEYGVKEVVGKGSNRTIIGWRDELNGAAPAGKPLVSGFSDDDVAWCGLFAAIITYRRLKNILEVVASPLWARNWAQYGDEVATRRKGKLAVKSGMAVSLGDILVFERGDGGHVGFYIAEDEACYHVLGGNQGNRVSIVRIDKNRLLNARRPPYKTVPRAVKPYRVASSGDLSINEA